MLTVMLAFGLAVTAPATPMALPPATPPAVVPEAPPPVESDFEAWLADAREYAMLYDVPLAQAVGELELQEATVTLTDRLRATWKPRFASLYIDHKPRWRIVVWLTGDMAVASQAPIVNGVPVIVDFKVGAAATEAQMLASIEHNEAELQAATRHPPGIGIDPRTGTLIAIVRGEDLARTDARTVAKKLEAIAGMPVAISSWAESDKDLSAGNSGNAGDYPALAGGYPASAGGYPPLAGGYPPLAGGRALGRDPRDGRKYLCTTGFAVTDGQRTAITTAAHCPDALDYVDRERNQRPLTRLGAWGARYQDVQIQSAGTPLDPLLRADDPDRPRSVTGWRNRASTRAGDFLCHRGERTGYSCAEVKFVDYAPPGDLCAGPCPALWVAVKGPHCKSGDSGGPVFVGTIAFGLTKGASYTGDGTCKLYYYMSTDYLPPGWTLLYRKRGAPAMAARPSPQVDGVAGATR